MELDTGIHDVEPSDQFYHDLRSDLARSFVPRLLVSHVAGLIKHGEESLKVNSFLFPGVCMVVDVLGFASLTQSLCEARTQGVEGLQVCTTVFMGKLASVVHEHGGDVIKFAGGTLLCVFSEDKFTGGSSQDSARRTPAAGSVDVAISALLCAEELRNIRTDRLSVRVALSCGELCFGILGGVENRWECLISGPCMKDLSECLGDASTMQVVIASEYLILLKSHAPQTATTESGKTLSDSFVEVLTITAPSGQYSLQHLDTESGNTRLISLSLETTSSQARPASASVAKPWEADTALKTTIDRLIRQFVPAPIVEELDSATGLSYFAEIREVTTMFMKWDSYDANDKHRDLMTLQACFYQAQRILHSSGAYLRQFLVDDKGCVLIACWGMPNMSYVDNTYRALSAAAQIRQELDRLGMQTSVGITCDYVYCGIVGSTRRREYAAIGSPVNMAARLTARAKGRLLVAHSAYKRLPAAVMDHLQAIDAFKMTVGSEVEVMDAYAYVTLARTATVSADHSVTATSELSVPASCRAPLLALLQSLAAEQQQDLSVSSRPVKQRHVANFLPFSLTLSQGGGRGGTAAASTVVSTAGDSTPLPLELVSRQSSADPSIFRGLSRTVSRGLSMATITAPLRCSSHPAPVVLLSGGHDTGKASVAAWVRAKAAEFRIHTAGVRVAKSMAAKPYAVCKALFQQLIIGKSEYQANDGQWSYVAELLHEVFPNLAQLSGQVNLVALSDALGVGADVFTETGMGGGPISHSEASRPRKPLSVQDASHLREALVKVFAHLLAHCPALVVMEAIHYADEASLDVLARLLPKLRQPSALVVTALVLPTQVKAASAPKYAAGTPSSLFDDLEEVSETDKRAMSETDYLSHTSWYRTYRDLIIKPHRGSTVLTLAGYTPSDIDDMLCALLNVDTAPTEVAQLVQYFSGGSYFWVREILQFIKEHGADKLRALVEDRRRCIHGGPMLRPRPSIALAAPLLRDTTLVEQILAYPSFPSVAACHAARHPHPHQSLLDRLVLCRFSNLSGEAQCVLRVASVIGFPTFTTAMVVAALPDSVRPRLEDCLRVLVGHNWLCQDAGNPQIYTANAHIVQVVYELTPVAERNRLYAEIAAFMERTSADDASQYSALCHYHLHSDTDRALQYACKAVAMLIHTVDSVYDYADAVNLLGSVLPACHTTFDVDVLLKLVETCKRHAQRFGMKFTGAFRHQMSYHHPPFSLARFLTSCLPQGLRIHPQHGYVEEPSDAVDPEVRRKFVELMSKPVPELKDTLREAEQAARADYVRQLSRMSLLLSRIYVEIAEARLPHAPKDWQITFIEGEPPKRPLSRQTTGGRTSAAATAVPRLTLPN